MARVADQRAELATEAARLLAEDGIVDWRFAKQKAAERLGYRKAQWPTNVAIAEALAEHLRLYGGKDYRQRCQRLRSAALELMQTLSGFSPLATGAVVNRLITPRSSIELHLFADPPELVDIFLGDHGIPFDDEERTLQHADGRSLAVPVCRLGAAGELEAELLIFESDARRWSPLSPIDGRPMQRLSRAALIAWIAKESSAQ